MFTVLGASGVIGRALVEALKARGEPFQAIGRHDSLPPGDWGHTIYAIGLTADFRTRPLETVEAHVCTLIDVLKLRRFETLLYLSSTRVYAGSDSTREDATLHVAPADPSDLYNLSKLAGEAAALGVNGTRVARLSNVYGPAMGRASFLGDVIGDGISSEEVIIRSPAAASKDYVSIENTVEALLAIATRGRQRVYNVAAGENTSNEQIADLLRAHLGCTVRFEPCSRALDFIPIDISRLTAEFGIRPRHLMNEFGNLIEALRRKLPHDS